MKPIVKAIREFLLLRVVELPVGLLLIVVLRRIGYFESVKTEFDNPELDAVVLVVMFYFVFGYIFVAAAAYFAVSLRHPPRTMTVAACNAGAFLLFSCALIWGGTQAANRLWPVILAMAAWNATSPYLLRRVTTIRSGSIR